jgi:hypothetical protein
MAEHITIKVQAVGCRPVALYVPEDVQASSTFWLRGGRSVLIDG